MESKSPNVLWYHGVVAEIKETRLRDAQSGDELYRSYVGLIIARAPQLDWTESWKP